MRALLLIVLLISGCDGCSRCKHRHTQMVTIPGHSETVIISLNPLVVGSIEYPDHEIPMEICEEWE